MWKVAFIDNYVYSISKILATQSLSFRYWYRNCNNNVSIHPPALFLCIHEKKKQNIAVTHNLEQRDSSKSQMNITITSFSKNRRLKNWQGTEWWSFSMFASNSSCSLSYCCCMRAHVNSPLVKQSCISILRLCCDETSREVSPSPVLSC